MAAFAMPPKKDRTTLNTHTNEPRLQTMPEAHKTSPVVQGSASTGLSQAEIRRLVMETIG